MAVIQISKIQLRRGKEQEEGIPQLASGEMAWAIDTQKLFIGNGAVSEGAPQVGNTRLLTDKDNIFELAQDYQYREGNSSIQTGLSVNYPVQITLQEKLDEKVTNVEYGILSNGQDQAANIQNAIDNLFLNPAYLSRNDLRVTLEFLPGTYLISTTIFLPSNVTIVGAGVDKTVFQFTGLSQPAFRFINDSSTKTSRSTLGSTTYINQPKNVFLKGFTVQSGDPTVNGFQIDAVRDSVFEDIKIVGSYGDSGSNQSKGLDISALSSIVTTQRNHFVRMKFDGMKYGVSSKYDIRDNIWSNCEFVDGYIAVNFGEGTDLSSTGQMYGPRSNIITDCVFSNIDREGIFVVNGHGNRSFGNIFSNVGNDAAAILIIKLL
jgi:parallel beta-helix repeat protein